VTQTPATETPPRKKVRPPPRPVMVERVERMTPGMVRIVFSGADLGSFEQSRPGGHMKLFFPPTDAAWPPAADAPRPPSRTYTPRRYDAARGLLEVEFVLHGEGLAAIWAEHARVGDCILVSGPGGGYAVPEGVARLVIVADDAALPAVGTILEALPAGCQTTILCEVEGPAEERDLSPVAASHPTWLHRGPTGARPGDLLEAAARSMAREAADAHWWVACEAGTMRRIRDFLAGEAGIERARLHTRGYWKFGEHNHPDHDYGED